MKIGNVASFAKRAMAAFDGEQRQAIQRFGDLYNTGLLNFGAMNVAQTDSGFGAVATPDTTNKDLHKQWFGLTGGAKQAYAQYKNLYANYGAILQCQYAVYLNNPLGIGKNIPWFNPDFKLSWLATEVDMSLGSFESDHFNAGGFQLAYITGMSSGSIDVTFIETRQGHIANSYNACKKLIVNADGTVNEPAKYAFELDIHLLGHNQRLNPNGNYKSDPIFATKHMVCVKEASISLSSTGRSEIAKVVVTFEKIAPNVAMLLSDLTSKSS